MEDQVQQLVTAYQTGKVSRRLFLKRAAILLGGTAMANALILALSGAPVHQVAEAAGLLDGTAPATPPATQAATPSALEIQTAMVTFQGNGQAPGYLAQPTAPGTYPGVVVIQEWWGVDAHIKDVTERFAKVGFVALAPDLYRGQVAKEPGDAQRLMMKLQRDSALKDIQGAVDYLVGQTQVSPPKIGVIGFCFGGGLAMNMAYLGENVGAVASFYGAGVDPSNDDIKNVTSPVIGFYGDKDPNFTVDKINTWAAEFKAAGKINEMHIYPGAAHAFFNDTEASYVNSAAEDAWARTLSWFHTYLVADMATPVVTMGATQAN